ncbi:30S ribosomal protein S15 [Glycomyces paridis]|uniref:Small ribosomal subunit protein uS15 n=1 Tax=Glycomyces paridis TaxID=2126555 RepID=A0A4S8PMI2_9ACTN|nr:30S ribosomal protein S15 [Glycomyces paridis]THV31351.1 30S ribosomal protein S15 [Glycomyces paridis]
MALDAEKKSAIIKEYALTEGDSGSTDVQVAILTARIKELTAHVQEHKHDHHSTRGLLLLVGKRKRLLKYLKKEDITRYRALIERLGIRDNV